MPLTDVFLRIQLTLRLSQKTAKFNLLLSRKKTSILSEIPSETHLHQSLCWIRGIQNFSLPDLVAKANFQAIDIIPC